MFQQVVRWTFIVAIWKKYKGQLLTVIGYLATLWLISMVHDDYLAYVAAAGEGNQSVGTSFAAKWLAYFVFTVVFYWVFQRVSKSNESGHKGLGFLAKFRGFGKASERQKDATGVWQETEKLVKNKHSSEDTNKQGEDPFANIRQKKTLRSEADLIFELKDSDSMSRPKIG